MTVRNRDMMKSREVRVRILPMPLTQTAVALTNGSSDSAQASDHGTSSSSDSSVTESADGLELGEDRESASSSRNVSEWCEDGMDIHCVTWHGSAASRGYKRLMVTCPHQKIAFADEMSDSKLPTYSGSWNQWRFRWLGFKEV